MGPAKNPLPVELGEHGSKLGAVTAAGPLCEILARATSDSDDDELAVPNAGPPLRQGWARRFRPLARGEAALEPALWVTLERHSKQADASSSAASRIGCPRRRQTAPV
ncbi:MAG: hypothetical protein QOE15_1117 [Acidimicrobiaceae bacterium]|nr:hypothetical protein [Acidimicrobiaceae bacterium]